MTEGLTAEDGLKVVALLTLLTQTDPISHAELFADASVSHEVLFPVVAQRVRMITKVIEDNEPETDFEDVQHRISLAGMGWMDGFIAGVRWNRILTTGTDQRK